MEKDVRRTDEPMREEEPKRMMSGLNDLNSMIAPALD